MKEQWKPGTVIYPLPAVLVSCGANPDEYNLVTVAWTGTVCTSPPMCYISLRPERHSYEIIRRTGEFVINLTTERMARAVDWCGVRSGRDYDKFRETGLTAAPARTVSAPIVEEAPVNIECRVKQILPLGSHDMFLAEVVGVSVDDAYVDAGSGRFDMERARLIAYSHGEYFALGEAIGRFGWSVRRRPRKKGAEGRAEAGRAQQTAAVHSAAAAKPQSVREEIRRPGRPSDGPNKSSGPNKSNKSNKSSGPRGRRRRS